MVHVVVRTWISVFTKYVKDPQSRGNNQTWMGEEKFGSAPINSPCKCVVIQYRILFV